MTPTAILRLNTERACEKSEKAPKGRHSIAWGKAPGTAAAIPQALKGRNIGFISPFQGLGGDRCFSPARCAGLLNVAPSGLFTHALSGHIAGLIALRASPLKRGGRWPLTQR